MQSESIDWQSRLAALEQRVAELEQQNRKLQSQWQDQAEKLAYQYIYLHWLWIRWVLLRDQDRSSPGEELYERAKACEEQIWYATNRRLKGVKFAPLPMEVAMTWRIECTVILNRHRYTFLD